jgi:Leucine-rich repeat (LRR) protein
MLSISNNNNISDMQVLSGLTNLTELQFANTQVTDIQPLANMPNLTRADLRNNRITDWSPVAHVGDVQGRPRR